MTSDRLKQDVPWIEPIDAYARLRNVGAVLLDGMGEHPEARYAYVATGFEYELRVTGRCVVVTRNDGQVSRFDGDPLPVLRRYVQDIRRDVDEPEGFTGGLVGYFGYEFHGLLEPTLPHRHADTPDAVLWNARDVVVFDRQERRAWVWANGHLAKQRVARIIKLLERDPPIRGLPPAKVRWQTSLDATGFKQAVKTAKRYIDEGDIYQVNLATRFTTTLALDPVAVYRSLARNNPSPFMALIEADDHSIVSCSPEQLLSVSAGQIRTRPIAGTRPRGTNAEEDTLSEKELVSDPKEAAEHTMLVDLLRNDIAKVSVPGSVRVAEWMSVERYRHVMHLVSQVVGDVRDDADPISCLAATFPGGTITGTPKHRACQRIHGLEPVPRGPYTGSAGYISLSHNCHFNIMIRTLVLRGDEVRVHAGSGIVADSQPEQEWKEAGAKAQALLDAATGQDQGGATRVGEVRARATWEPPQGKPVTARVHIIDNYDSFTHNLADYVAALGAEVHVTRNDEPLEKALAWGPTHLIIGPGPGGPEEAALSLNALEDFTGPVLGVCLGHQAMAYLCDVPIIKTGPVHGKTATIRHDGKGLFAGVPSPMEVARYHSLGVHRDALGDGWVVDAALDDGTVMAMRHAERRWYGVQFHPESVVTDHGLQMLRNFLVAP